MVSSAMVSVFVCRLVNKIDVVLVKINENQNKDIKYAAKSDEEAEMSKCKQKSSKALITKEIVRC